MKKLKKTDLTRPGTGKRQKLHDGDGLYLLISATGKSRKWLLDWKENGQRREFAFGHYDPSGQDKTALSLSEAREMRSKLRYDIKRGIDPRKEKKTREHAQNFDFEHFYDQFMMSYKRRVSEKTYENNSLRVEKHLRFYRIDALGERFFEADIREIKPKHLLAFFDHLYHDFGLSADGGATPAKIKTLLTGVFDLAVFEEVIESNPVLTMNRQLRNIKPRSVSKEPISFEKDEAAFAAALKKIVSYDTPRVDKSLLCALRLAPHLVLRPGELLKLEKSWVDLDAALVTIPAAAIEKGNRETRVEHIVPLSIQASELLYKALRLCQHDKYVFFSRRSGSGLFSTDALTNAKKRAGVGSEQHVHGFRKNFSTWAHERGFDSHAIEMQLSHMDKDGIRATYNHAKKIEYRRIIMQEWSDYLETVKIKYR